LELPPKILQGCEDIFGAIWLIQLQSADASGEKRFDVHERERAEY